MQSLFTISKMFISVFFYDLTDLLRSNREFAGMRNHKGKNKIARTTENKLAIESNLKYQRGRVCCVFLTENMCQSVAVTQNVISRLFYLLFALRLASAMCCVNCEHQTNVLRFLKNATKKKEEE